MRLLSALAIAMGLMSMRCMVLQARFPAGETAIARHAINQTMYSGFLVNNPNFEGSSLKHNRRAAVRFYPVVHALARNLRIAPIEEMMTNDPETH